MSCILVAECGFHVCPLYLKQQPFVRMCARCRVALRVGGFIAILIFVYRAPFEVGEVARCLNAVVHRQAVFVHVDRFFI